MPERRMDEQRLLRTLCDLSLEEGKRYIQEHIAELNDVEAISHLLEREALNQLYTNSSISLKIAELLIFFGEYVSHKPSQALGLKAKGDVLKGIGLHQAALDCLDAAGKEFLLLGNEGDWGRSRVSWIISCAWLGRVEEALQEAARAREMFERLGDHYWACVIDHNTAVIYKQVGRYQEALNLYQRMLTIYPTLKEQGEVFIARAIAMAKVSYSITLAWVGEFERAYQLEQEAQATFRRLEETSMVINSEVNLANLDYTLGYYGSALKRYYQARDSVLEDNIDPGLLLPEINLWMAKCLGKLNKTEEALALARSAVEMYRSTGMSLSTGEALREYATTLIASGRLKEGMIPLDEARILFKDGGFEHHASAAQLQQAEILLELQEFETAYTESRAVEAYFHAKGLLARSVHASLVVVSALVGIAQKGGLSQEQEQRATVLNEALAICKYNALQARRCYLQEEVYKSQHLLGTIYLLQGSVLKASRHYESAIVQLERIMDDLLYDLSPSFLRTAWAVYEDMIALCLEQSQFERAFAYLERARSIALRQYLIKSQAVEEKGGDAAVVANRASLSRTQQELERWQAEYHRYSTLLATVDTLPSSADKTVISSEIKRCEEKITELFERLHLYQVEAPARISSRKRVRRNKLTDMARLSQELLPGQMMLTYCLCKDTLVIFALTTEGLTTHLLADGVRQLDYLLSVLHARLHSSAQLTQQTVILRLLQKLYALLIAPVAALLPPTPASLIIVPYGPLHQLPFHALHDGSQHLIEKFQMSYLPTSGTLTWFSRKKRKASQMSENEEARKPLLLGYSGKGSIQQVVEETTAIARLLDGNCYLENEATITQLVAQVGGSPLIHIATHGNIRWDAPNFSSVLLADGRLSAIDVFNLQLDACELVTLSGCETGLARIGGGDEQVGLGRAFLAAGAHSSLMSLWPVEDKATYELMQVFYQYLLQGENKAQALRLAQCALMHQTSSGYDHPYFWASFRLVGDSSPLSYHPTATHSQHPLQLQNDLQKNESSTSIYGDSSSLT